MKEPSFARRSAKKAAITISNTSLFSKLPFKLRCHVARHVKVNSPLYGNTSSNKLDIDHGAASRLQKGSSIHVNIRELSLEQMDAIGEFVLFSELPLELRRKVVQYALLPSRIVELIFDRTDGVLPWAFHNPSPVRNPPIMSVNREMREESLRYLKPLQSPFRGSLTVQSNYRAYVNPLVDVFLIDNRRHGNTTRGFVPNLKEVVKQIGGRISYLSLKSDFFENTNNFSSCMWSNCKCPLNHFAEDYIRLDRCGLKEILVDTPSYFADRPSILARVMGFEDFLTRRYRFESEVRSGAMDWTRLAVNVEEWCIDDVAAGQESKVPKFVFGDGIRRPLELYSDR